MQLPQPLGKLRGRERPPEYSPKTGHQEFGVPCRPLGIRAVRRGEGAMMLVPRFPQEVRQLPRGLGHGCAGAVPPRLPHTSMTTQTTRKTTTAFASARMATLNSIGGSKLG